MGLVSAVLSLRYSAIGWRCTRELPRTDEASEGDHRCTFVVCCSHTSTGKSSARNLICDGSLILASSNSGLVRFCEMRTSLNPQRLLFVFALRFYLLFPRLNETFRRSGARQTESLCSFSRNLPLQAIASTRTCYLLVSNSPSFDSFLARYLTRDSVGVQGEIIQVNGSIFSPSRAQFRPPSANLR